MIYGSAFGTGVAMATIQSLRPDFSFQISFSTLVAFVLGTVGLIAYWKLIFSPRPSRRLRSVATFIVAVVGILCFLYPIRFIAPNKWPELAEGLFRAVFALSAGAALLLSCKRFFDADEQSNAQSNAA
ncbi:MAG: hypothetical protein JWM68_4002 [Verrucomicrobiales bacterium]|nr:hypothetical protein [Verrucomicrobiales bacterium]